MSNLKFRLIHYSRDKVKDGSLQWTIYAWSGWIGGLCNSQYQNSYTIDVFDSPGSWQATITTGTTGSNLKGGTDAASGVANDDTQLKLKIPYFNNENIGVGRKATCYVDNRAPDSQYWSDTMYTIDPIIKFVDAYGNVLERSLFPIQKSWWQRTPSRTADGVCHVFRG